MAACDFSIAAAHPAPRGISVGSEWTYRSFIEGGSAAAAVWTLDGINESVLGTDAEGKKFLPLELIVRVFRTYKGDIEQGIQGSIRLRNPDNPDMKSNEDIFTAADASINDDSTFRCKLYNGHKEIDLLKDFVTKDGRLEVVVQCLDGAQYFGFAQPDLYLRLPAASPVWNYIKAQIGIWVQMVLVISIGVTASTLLNGPVAMLFTVSFILLGFFRAVLRQRGDREASRRRTDRIACPNRHAKEPDDRPRTGLRRASDAMGRLGVETGDAQPGAGAARFPFV